mgnify:CR=1 FL=1
MKAELRDLIVAAIESGNYIAKSDSELNYNDGESEIKVEFDLIVSVKSITSNNETVNF